MYCTPLDLLGNGKSSPMNVSVQKLDSVGILPFGAKGRTDSLTFSASSWPAFENICMAEARFLLTSSKEWRRFDIELASVVQIRRIVHQLLLRLLSLGQRLDQEL